MEVPILWEYIKILNFRFGQVDQTPQKIAKKMAKCLRTFIFVPICASKSKFGTRTCSFPVTIQCIKLWFWCANCQKLPKNGQIFNDLYLLDHIILYLWTLWCYVI